MTKPDFDNLSIQKAFDSHFYTVPDYQREYVWDIEQVEQLLEDIDAQMGDSSPEYFIGTIIVSPREEGESNYDVIDGQQRLTTIFLILCVLRFLLAKTEPNETLNRLTKHTYTDSGGSDITRYRLELKYEHAEEVIQKIISLSGEPEIVRANIEAEKKENYGSIKRILDAYGTIHDFLKKNYGNEDELKKYWGHLSNNITFIQISTDVSNALKIFETINERGVGLNPMDLLKNLLFTQISPKDFSKLKKKWEKVTHPLEKNNEKSLRFLRYFILANYNVGKVNEDVKLKENEIYQWLRKNSKNVGYEKEPFKFVERVIKNVDLYIGFNQAKDNRGEKSIPMQSLWYLARNSIKQHHILLLAGADLPQHIFNQFVNQLESYLFYNIFTKSHGNELERNFANWAPQLREITQIENSKKLIDELNSFVDRKFKDKMLDKKDDLDFALRRMALGSMQKYRIQYLLARLTEHVEMEFTGNKSRDGFDRFFKLEIEHILPDTPEDDLLDTWQRNHPDLNYDEFKNRLGNLTLLEKPINIVAGNNFYTDKVIEYAKSANYITRSLSSLTDVGQDTSISRINQKLLSFDKWNAKNIEKRQEMLIDLVHEVWKITEIKA